MSEYQLKFLGPRQGNSRKGLLVKSTKIRSLFSKNKKKYVVLESSPNLLESLQVRHDPGVPLPLRQLPGRPARAPARPLPHGRPGLLHKVAHHRVEALGASFAKLDIFLSCGDIFAVMLFDNWKPVIVIFKFVILFIFAKGKLCFCLIS